MYKTLVLKILNTRQQRTVFSEKREINEVSFMTAPAYYLTGFKDHVSGKRNMKQLWWVPWTEKGELEF